MERNPMQIAARSEAAWRWKRQRYSLVEESFAYAAPGVDPYLESMDGEPSESRGVPAYEHIFDSTLIHANDKLANRMKHEAMPIGRHWGQMKAGPMFGVVNGSPQTKGQNDRDSRIQGIQKKSFAALAASNFDLQCQSMMHDGTTAGTGILFGGISGQDSSTLLHWEAVSQSQVALEGGARGMVWGIYRRLKADRDTALSLWPGARIPPDVKTDEAGLPRKRQYIEATYFDLDRSLWHYVVDVQDEKSERVESRDYVVNPWITWRYSLRPGEIEGRSPTQAALPAARTLNKAKRTQLELASVRVAGIWTYTDDSVFNPNTAVMESGTFLPVGSNSRESPTIRPLELPGDPQFGLVVVDDERGQIREIMMDDALPPATGAVRSATEIMERQRQALINYGLGYQRLLEEVARPVLRLTTYLLAEAGAMNELSDVSGRDGQGRPLPLRMDGSDVELSFQSPLNTLQQIDDANRIVGWSQASQQAAGPRDYAAGVRTERIPGKLAELMSTPLDLVVPEEEQQERLQMQSQLAAPPQGQMAEGAPA